MNSTILWVMAAMLMTCACDGDVSTSSQESSETVAAQTVNTGRRGAPNPKTSLCPHGEAYLDGCNWARCSPEGHVSSTEKLCLVWTCEDGLREVADQACYGACTCNATTLATSCERKGCYP